MTTYEYIHEWDFYEEAMSAADFLIRESTVAAFEHKHELELAEKKVMFENADYDVLVEAANENFFARIGNAILKLIEKIKEFVKNIFDKFVSKKQNKQREENIAIIKNYSTKDPEFQKKVLEALENGDITYKDVKELNDGVTSLKKLFDQNDIDGEVVNKKVNDLCDKVERSAPVRIGKTLGTVAAAVGGVVTLSGLVIGGVNIASGMIDTGKKMKSHVDAAEKLVRARSHYLNDKGDALRTQKEIDSLEDVRRNHNRAMQTHNGSGLLSSAELANNFNATTQKYNERKAKVDKMGMSRDALIKAADKYRKGDPRDDISKISEKKDKFNAFSRLVVFIINHNKHNAMALHRADAILNSLAAEPRNSKALFPDRKHAVDLT